MKTFKTFFLILTWILLSMLSVYSQDLSQFVPIVHYTLINTSADSLGNYDTIQLKNAPFQGLDGVYSNGIYPGNNTNGCTIRTPIIDGFDYSKFAFSLEFKRDIGFKDKPVIVAGNLWRYLGARISPHDTTIQLIYNGTHTNPTGSISTEPNTWYRLTVIYQDSTGYLYLDDNLVDSIQFVIKSKEKDKVFLNIHGGYGRTFKGNWRNLIIYKAGTSATGELNDLSGHFDIYPNPNSGIFTVKSKENNSGRYLVQLIDLQGKIVFSKKITNLSSGNRIDAKGLNTGIYLLKITDENEKSYSKKIIINR